MLSTVVTSRWNDQFEQHVDEILLTLIAAAIQMALGTEWKYHC